MHQNNKTQQTNNNTIEEVQLLEYVVMLVNYRWMIFRNLVITGLVAIIISFILPAKYTAVTTLMPPQESDRLSMSSILSDVSLPGVSLPTDASPADIMVEILKSRSVGERVLSKKFKFKNEFIQLYEIIDEDSLEIALLHIDEFAYFSASDQGIISISVELKDRTLAADVANSFVEELDKVKQEKSVSQAKNSRIYIESQLEKTENKLQEASEKLVQFQEQNKAISLEIQMQTSIFQVSELKGEIIAKQIQLGVMQQTMKPENPLVLQVKNEIEELQKLYTDMQFGNLSKQPDDQNEDFYLPFADVPKVGIELAKLTREVKVQETVWKLLNQQYYQEKIEEARNTPTIQVLDRATPPVRRSSPKRMLIIIGFGFIALLFSILGAFIKEYFLKLKNRPGDKQRLESIMNAFKQDIYQIKLKLHRNS